MCSLWTGLRGFTAFEDKLIAKLTSEQRTPPYMAAPSDREVEHFARTFRAAIDSAGLVPWQDMGIDFPHGACGHVAELLGKYLKDKLEVYADYVCQTAYENIGGWHGGHAWLEWNGLTIDISGDQFGWASTIVTREPIFHGLGGNTVRHRVCLEHQRDWWIENCGSLWLAIIAHLPTADSQPEVK